MGARLTQAETLTRELKALNLRRAGHGFDTIAKQCGYTNRSAARKAYIRALNRVVEETVDLDLETKLELARLDQMVSALWPAVLKGDLGAHDRALRISAQRIALLERLVLSAAPVPAPAPSGDEEGGDPVASLEAARQRRRTGA